MDKVEKLTNRADALITRLESILHESCEPVDWSANAWRWQTRNGCGYLHAVHYPHGIALADIHNVDDQKAEIVRNTRQFLQKLPANHVLLTGARGTGKSSLIKALLNEYNKAGLRLIEVQKQDLVHLPEIVALIRNRPERFIVFCDDLSFEAVEPAYKALKVVLDGTVDAASENVLIYATSNRKHLMPQLMAENLATQYVEDEVRPAETTEEKNALAERFGMWLSFYPFTQDEYLRAANYWIDTMGANWDKACEHAALQFSLKRGSRSGRVAYQFAKDFAGSQQLESAENTKQEVHAAVAILIRENGDVLFSERPAGKIWSGWWEFPGGKIEQGESAEAALKRELAEELGIDPVVVYPWVKRVYEYPERTVHLHFFRVYRWFGTLQGKENQQLLWQAPDAVTITPVLPSNAPVLRALQLPDTMAITHLESTQSKFFSKLKLALEEGLRMVQIRAPQLNEHDFNDFAQLVMARTRPYGAKVFINANPDLARALGADGVHFKAHQLMELREKPVGLWSGASCHNAQELAQAAKLDLDYVTLSPVQPTQSHPDAQTLGWKEFSELVAGYPLPVYALGGMHAQDLTQAMHCGAHGIAMQRGVW